MTTEHSHEEILARLDRVIELLEDIHNTRKGKIATGGIVQTTQPPSSTQINFEGAQAIADATVHKLRREGRLR